MAYKGIGIWYGYKVLLSTYYVVYTIWYMSYMGVGL
jgi:hypothetical protein